MAHLSSLGGTPAHFCFLISGVVADEDDEEDEDDGGLLVKGTAEAAASPAPEEAELPATVVLEGRAENHRLTIKDPKVEHSTVL